MLNASSIETEALRIVREEREAERRAAFEAQRRAMAELAEIAEHERIARVQLEAEKIEAQKRAEEALIAAKAKAEKEAYDAAVAAKVAELKSRSEAEILRAELEELRESLMTTWSPWKNEIEKVKSQVTGCPWNSGIVGLDKKLEELKSSLMDIARMVKKPARDVHVWFCSGMTKPHNSDIYAGHQQLTLRLIYTIVDQSAVHPNSGQLTSTMTITDRSGSKISVDGNKKVFVNSAHIMIGGNASGDLTHLYKGMIESQ